LNVEKLESLNAGKLEAWKVEAATAAPTWDEKLKPLYAAIEPVLESYKYSYSEGLHDALKAAVGNMVGGAAIK
jgi:hypothetical protein